MNETGESAAGVTAGTLLRQAREAAGLHVAVLAVSLKVPVNKLEALEMDRIDQLPDAVFARALAASVCRTLKVDPAPILDRLPHNRAPRLAEDVDGINTPFRVPGENSRSSSWNQLSRPVVLAVLALLLGALVLIFMPDVHHNASVAQALAPVAIPAAHSADAAPQGHVASPQAPATLTSAVVPAAGPQETTTPVTAALPPAPAAASDATMVFTARAESWVQVTDATGKALLRKTLAPSEVSDVSGALPLSVVIGRADAIAVQVKGQPFDLAPSTKNNIARFEVK